MTSGVQALMERTLSGLGLEIARGDITSQDDLDAVVNAADLEARLEDQGVDR